MVYHDFEQKYGTVPLEFIVVKSLSLKGFYEIFLLFLRPLGALYYMPYKIAKMFEPATLTLNSWHLPYFCISNILSVALFISFSHINVSLQSNAVNMSRAW